MTRLERLGSPGSHGTQPWVLTLWLVTAVIPGVIMPAEAETLYLAPGGNDAWSGRRAEPAADRSDGPVASLKGARDAVRRLRAAGAGHQAITVVVKPGVYRLGATVELLPEDSGTSSAPVTYETREHGPHGFQWGAANHGLDAR